MTSKKDYPHSDMTKEEFKAFVMDYFETVKKKGNSEMTFLTLPGLANYIDWNTEDLINFPSSHKFFPVIRLARQLIEESLVHKMLKGEIDKTNGVFMLKNHFGYKEKNDSPPPGSEKKTISEILDSMQ